MKIIKFGLLMLLVAELLACNSKAPVDLYGTDISGADFANGFNLTDHTGKARKLEDFHGKVVALFFGYTHCPDVCPTTMADLASAMKLLGEQSDQIQVLFITLDPERDTQEVLSKFIPSFDIRFIGLFGSAEATAETAKNFKIFYAKQAEQGKSGYTIDHSAGVYVFDKTGHVRIYLKYGEKPAEVASDLKQLL